MDTHPEPHFLPLFTTISTRISGVKAFLFSEQGLSGESCSNTKISKNMDLAYLLNVNSEVYVANPPNPWLQQPKCYAYRINLLVI